jgi:hypothetical protein
MAHFGLVSVPAQEPQPPIRYGHVFFLLYVSQAVALHEVQFDVSSPKHHLRHLLGNHDGRRIGVPTDNLGHHTCVHHA